MTLNDNLLNLPALEQIIEPPVTVSPDLPLLEAISLMHTHTSGSAGCSSSSALAIADHRVVGIITEKDIVKLCASEQDLTLLRVKDVMSQPVITGSSAQCQDWFGVLNYLHSQGLQHLPIVEGDQLIGVVTLKSLGQAIEPLSFLKLKQVGEVVSKVIALNPDCSLLAIAQLMHQHQTSCVVICRGKRPVGIITEQDIVQFQAKELNLKQIKAKTVMSSPLLNIYVSDSLWQAHLTMQQHQVQHLVVTDHNGELKGILTQTNLLEAFNSKNIFGELQQLQQVVAAQTEQLQQEIARRQDLEQQLPQYSNRLEQQVDICSTELSQTHTALQTTTQQHQQSQVQLQVGQTIVQAVFSQALDGMAILDAAGELNEVNPAACEILGLEAKQLLGRNFGEFLEHQEDWQLFCREPQKLAQTSLTIANGERKQIEYSVTMMLRDSTSTNEPVYLVIFRDVSAGYQSQMELQQSQQHLTNFIENAPIGLHWVDEHGIILWANCAELDLLGYSADEYIGHYIWEFHADQNTIEDILARLKNRETLHHYEAALRCKDGSIRYVLISSNVTWHNNQFVHTRCFTQDITARKRAEAALSLNEQQFRSLVENAQNFALYRVETNAQLEPLAQTVVVSPSITEIMGVENPNDFSSWFDHIHPEDLPEVMQAQIRSSQQNLPFNQTMRIFHPGKQQWRWIQAMSHPVVDTDAEQSYFNGIIIDITSQKQAQEELELFFAVTPTVFCLAGMDGYFRRVNPAFLQILGWSEAETLGQPLLNFVHPDDRQATLTELGHLAAGRATLAFENRYRTVNGDYRWLLWKAKSNLEQRIIYAAAIDITERKQTELDLQESEERWQLALRGANDGIWDWNVRSDQVFFSQRWKTMLGYQDDEIIPSLEEWSKRLHPDDLEPVRNQIKAHFNRQTPFYISEHRLRCRDGSYKWILDRGQALWDDDGNVLRMSGSHSDITERKQAELKLQQERDFTSAILETVGALVAVINRQGQIVRFNQTCEQTTGWSEAEVLGKCVWDFLVLEAERSAYKLVFLRLLEGQVPNQYENYWVAKDHTQHRISWSNTALFDDRGQVEYVVATGIDVTQQRQVQAQLEQQYRQTHILAEISRKIRVSIKLEDILQTSVEEIQNLLLCDRVMIVRRQNQSSFIPIQEAVLPNLPRILGYQLSDPLLLKPKANYHRGEVLAIEDLNQIEIEPGVQQILEHFKIKAKLVVPILSHPVQRLRAEVQSNEPTTAQEQLEALLVVHQCTSTRAWQTSEIRLLQQLADQIGVALSQAQLLNQLEELVAERTTDLIATNQQLLAEIEQHQQTESALREIQQKLSGILDNANEAIISIDQQQKIQLFNQGAEKIFGYRATEIMGEPLDLLLPEALRSIHRQHVNRFDRSISVNRNMAERNSEVYGLRQDGSTFPAEASISKLQLRDGILFTVILKDISDRKQAEAAILRSEEQLRLITNALPSLIAYIDSQQRYQFNNRAHENWFGKTTEQINGSSIKKVIGRVAYKLVRPQVEKALSGQSVQFELDLSYQGQPRWLSICFIPDIGEANQIKGFFAMCNDISEQKAVEQIKSEFVSVASHEMRTPLTSIHGVLKLLSAGKLGELNDSGDKMVEIALRNTDRLIRLINDVLDLERMESGREVIQRQSYNTTNLIQQAVETIRPMADKHGVAIVVNSVAVELWVDGDRIIQLLTNLLSNAIKFSPINTQIDLTVKVGNDDALVLFSVKDQGRGIPANQLETIFERFQQVDASDSRKKGGTGLGLAICRHIVQQHGGQIWAQSTVGEGTCFYFTLPRN